MEYTEAVRAMHAAARVEARTAATRTLIVFSVTKREKKHRANSPSKIDDRLPAGVREHVRAFVRRAD